MPSRDDRTPSFCSERMKICQKHLSKVYSRSKNLLVTARAGKIVPEVTGSAARGFADGGTSTGDGNGLSSFEKKNLSPYLNAVAGLFDGPSLLKQFQLKKLQSVLTDKKFKSQSHPDCPQSCNESISKDPASIPLFFKDNRPRAAPTSTAGNTSDIKFSTKAATFRESGTGRPEIWSDDHIEASISSTSFGNESRPDGKVSSDLLQNTSAHTLSTIMEERVPVRQLGSDRLLQVGNSSNSALLPGNYRVDDKGKWSIPPHLSNISSDQRTFSKLVIPQSSFPSHQLSSGKSRAYRIDDNSTRNRSRLPHNEEHVRPISARNHSQRLLGIESQQKAISNISGKNPSTDIQGNDSKQRALATGSGRNPAQLSASSELWRRAIPTLNGRNPPQLGADSKKKAVSMKSGRNRAHPLSSTDLQQRPVSTMNSKNRSQLLPSTESQQKSLSTRSDANLHRMPLDSELQQGAVSTTTLNGPLEISSVDSQPRTSTNRRSFSKLLPNNDSQKKAVSIPSDSQPGSFASRLNKKGSKSGNVLQASVANFFGTTTGPSKPLHTLTVSQLHDAICDHSAPDCPSFKRKEKPGAIPQVPIPALLRPRLPPEEPDPPQADALGTEGSANPQSVDDFAPSRQEIVSANEKCAQYAFEVRTDMRRQEKSSANLWKYGSMAVCTENPGRDYTTGESPPDAWDLIAKAKFEISGFHWSKSGSRKVVNHVCQILKQNKWGSGTVELLEAVKGIINPHCVNAILQQQKDPQVCLAFFNWAKTQKGYKHDVFGFTTMINIVGRARNLRGVRHLLEDMHACGIEPNVATYNTLILCYGKVESLNESLRVFRIMQEAGCKPDNVTYSILIHLCIKAGYLQEALKLYQGMFGAGVQPDTITYSIVIDSVGKSGNLREARKLFREMKERGCVPNEFTYNSMINRHAKARKTQHSLRYYTEMRAAGFKLNAVTCTTMMSVLGSLGKVDQAEGLFSEMQQSGIVADTAAYGLMINMWGNSGNLDKAVSWYGRMLGNLVTPSLRVFSSLVNAHLEANLYQAAQHFLTSMGMWGINSDLKLYTILLRHCTVCEKQEHADAVLGIMDRLGHPAHRFLYELLTAKNQDRQSIRSRVASYFASAEHEDQENKHGFANALIEFLHKLQCKTDPGVVWEMAMEKGIFSSSIIRREAPNHWLADLHSLSVGTALVALPRLLVMLRDNWVQKPTKRVYIVTGWGKRSRVTGSSALKQAVSDVLEATRSPFSLDHANAGVFVSYGPPFCDWMSQPLTMKKLGIMVTEGVVK